MDEYDLFEAEHADEFDALDDLQIDVPGKFYRVAVITFWDFIQLRKFY